MSIKLLKQPITLVLNFIVKFDCISRSSSALEVLFTKWLTWGNTDKIEKNWRLHRGSHDEGLLILSRFSTFYPDTSFVRD